MPRYFFDIRDNNTLLRDDTGVELPSLDAARAEALAAVQEAVKCAAFKGERIGMHGIFEITDEIGQRLLSLTFETALEDVPSAGASDTELCPAERDALGTPTDMTNQETSAASQPAAGQ